MVYTDEKPYNVSIWYGNTKLVNQPPIAKNAILTTTLSIVSLISLIVVWL